MLFYDLPPPIPVLTPPGCKAYKWIFSPSPSNSISSCIEEVARIIPALPVLYDTARGASTVPEREAMLMIQPFLRFRMDWRAKCEPMIAYIDQYFEHKLFQISYSFQIELDVSPKLLRTLH